MIFCSNTNFNHCMKHMLVSADFELSISYHSKNYVQIMLGSETVQFSTDCCQIDHEYYILKMLYISKRMKSSSSAMRLPYGCTFWHRLIEIELFPFPEWVSQKQTVRNSSWISSRWNYSYHITLVKIVWLFSFLQPYCLWNKIIRCKYLWIAFWLFAIIIYRKPYWFHHFVRYRNHAIYCDFFLGMMTWRTEDIHYDLTKMQKILLNDVIITRLCGMQRNEMPRSGWNCAQGGMMWGHLARDRLLQFILNLLCKLDNLLKCEINKFNKLLWAQIKLINGLSLILILAFRFPQWGLAYMAIISVVE